MVSVQPNMRGNRRIIGRYDAALTRHHVLGRIERERPDRAPCDATRPASQVSLSGIFHDREAVPMGEGLDARHVCHQSEQVYRHHRSRRRRHASGRMVEIDEEVGASLRIQNRVDESLDGPVMCLVGANPARMELGFPQGLSQAAYSVDKAATNAACRAAVPFDTATAWWTPAALANSASNAAVSGP